MNFENNIPQIVALRKSVEMRFGKQLTVHNDFLLLVADIEKCLHEHISETTLERVWNYSTRGYNTVSLRTLDVLAKYCNDCSWLDFCKLQDTEKGVESELFSVESISSSDLTIGQRIRIGWLPNRLCIIKYLGDNRFVAEKCENATMKEGASFSCLQFTLGKEAILTDFKQNDSDAPGSSYAIGIKNGLTTLVVI